MLIRGAQISNVSFPQWLSTQWYTKGFELAQGEIIRLHPFLSEASNQSLCPLGQLLTLTTAFKLHVDIWISPKTFA